MSNASIFISHATPEDNDFVRWLGAKLELAGYQVWHDLARLKGGDYFWDKIENAYRNEAYRFWLWYPRDRWASRELRTSGR